MSWADRKDAPQRLRGRANQARRAQVLALHPVCRICRARPSTIADHIVNLATSGKDDRLVTVDEMQGLCIYCHNAKTAREAYHVRPSRYRQPEPHPGDV